VSKIKNFKGHINSLWEEYISNFINSLNPNPLEVIHLINDITLELVDDSDWEINTSIKMQDCDSFYKIHNFISTNDKKITINNHDDSEFLKCMESDNYQLIYDIIIRPPNRNEYYLNHLNDVLDKIVVRLESEFHVNIIVFRYTIIDRMSSLKEFVFGSRYSQVPNPIFSYNVLKSEVFGKSKIRKDQPYPIAYSSIKMEIKPK
jgi:hypothetical protein